MLELDMALPPDKPAPPDNPVAAGRITHDSRGNAVWNWISESGKIAIDSTSRLLKRLDSSDLSLEESDSTPKPEPGATATPGKPSASAPGRSAPAAQGGYDPYSSRTPARNKPAAPAPRPTQKPAPVSKLPVPKPSFLARILGRK
jgi:hypothetical protein